MNHYLILSVMIDFLALSGFLRHHLLTDVMPFWTRHAVDEKNGGLFTCISDEGKITSRDKYLWSQTRALWTFSALCRRIEPREEWRAIADGLFAFLAAHGRDANGHWVFHTDEKGTIIEGATSIYTESFAILGLTEYFLLTQSPEALRLALETCDSVSVRLAHPGSYPTAPYPTPKGMRAHGEAMAFSFAFTELGRAAAREDIVAAGRRLGTEVLEHFWKPEKSAFLEYITLENDFVDSPEGRAMVPGHGIESAYFQILNFRDAGEKRLTRRACDAIRICCERGWDDEFGGLFLGIDACERKPVYWKNATMKLWWPHTEALAGCLLAWETCGEDWCLQWYRKIHDYAFAKFPVPGHGEWTQRLDRAGRPATNLVALPVKDPFHLPRGLIYSIEALNRILGK